MHNVVVTGGSRGLGLGIARQLTMAGYRAIAIARHRGDQLDAAITEAERNGVGALQFISFDLGEIDDISDMVKTLRKEFGPVHGLVNNSALGSDGILATMHNAKIEKLVRLNTLSPVILTKYVARSMMADGGGRIVNVASTVGFPGYGGMSVYGATKAAMVGFTHALAREVGRLGVNVNAVVPDMADTGAEKGEDEHREDVAQRHKTRRLRMAEDVANAVEYLLSDKARNVTGAVMTIDGGVD